MRDEKEMYCKAVVSLAIIGCCVNLAILAILCRRKFRDISINFILCTILIWNFLELFSQILKCFEKRLAIALDSQYFPQIVFHADVIFKKMLIGTMAVFVVLRTASIVSPFTMKNVTGRFYQVCCLIPITLISPSFSFMKASFDSYVYHRGTVCPLAINPLLDWSVNDKITEYRNMVAVISVDVVLHSAILTSSAISVAFLAIPAKRFSKRKLRAICNILIFMTFLFIFFVPKTAHEMVKECVRFELMMETSKINDLLIIDPDGSMVLSNKTTPYTGYTCWSWMKDDTDDDSPTYSLYDISKRIHFNPDVFMRVFFTGKFLGILGNCLLGIVLIAPSSVYAAQIRDLVVWT